MQVRMRIARELLSLISFLGFWTICVAGDADRQGDVSHCQTASDGRVQLLLSGRIFSSESSCSEPIAATDIRLYLGCSNFNFFDLEPTARSKTGKNGSFEVSLPFPGNGDLVRMEVCVAPKRGCRLLAVEASGKSRPESANHQGNFPEAEGTPASNGISVSAERVGGTSRNYAARVNICLEEVKVKTQRKRSAVWDERDMNWLKRRAEGEKQEEGGVRKRGWSNGIPWLQRSHLPSSRDPEKRLWEGADEEVGWIKRGETEEGGSDEKESDVKVEGADRSAMFSGDRLPRNHAAQKAQRHRQVMGDAWAQPEQTKKRWAESDMSWL